MSLFTEEDVGFSEWVEEGGWSPTRPVLEQFREDFEGGCPTTEELENHDDWKITRRLPTGVSKLDGSHIDDAEKLEVRYCGDKTFDEDTISTFLPREYQ